MDEGLFGYQRVMEGRGRKSVALGRKKKFDVVDGYLEGGTGGSGLFDYRETASQKQVHPGGQERLTGGH